MSSCLDKRLPRLLNDRFDTNCKNLICGTDLNSEWNCLVYMHYWLILMISPLIDAVYCLNVLDFYY